MLSSLWPRGRIAWPRKRPVSFGLRRLLKRTEEKNCQLLQRKCAPFPNKSFGKNIVFVVFGTLEHETMLIDSGDYLKHF